MKYIKAFWKGFKEGLHELLFFERWYVMVVWFIIDAIMIFDLCRSVANSNAIVASLTGLIVWSVILGIHISATIKIYCDWLLKRKGLKQYFIMDKAAKECVDIIDQYDGNFDNKKLNLVTFIWNSDSCDYQIKRRVKGSDVIEDLLNFGDNAKNKTIETNNQEQTNNQE